MARTRSVEIQESLHELDQLRQYYRNTPQAQRLLFLYFLKEDPKRTISEAAEKAELSVRRGERLWESYRRGGVESLVTRREFASRVSERVGQNAMRPTEVNKLALDAGDVVALANAMSSALCSDSMGDFVSHARKSLMLLLPGLRHVVVNFRSIDQVNEEIATHMRLSDVMMSDGTKRRYLNRVVNEGPVYMRVIQDGKRLDFSFDDYSEPVGLDLFFGKKKSNKGEEAGKVYDQYVASLVMFFDKTAKIDISQVMSYFERSRPFLSCVMYCALLKYSSEREDRMPLAKAIEYSGYDPPLTTREQQVLGHWLLGKSLSFIADHLCVAKSTVATHLKSIYKKAGVNCYRELVSWHFSSQR